MSIDILAIGLPALADQMLTQRAPDLGWTLHRPGPDGLAPPEVADRIVGVAASGAATVDARLIDVLPALKIVSVHAVGYDLTDVAHARSRDVIVTHTPDVLNEDVADLALLLTLGTLRRLPAMDAYIRAGRWVSNGPPPLSRSATGLRYGLLGLGRIGQARPSHGGWNRSPEASPITPAIRSRMRPGGTCRTWSIWRPRSMC